ncbi:phage baseplate assembly protein V [Albimonas sp. CAU 1670]|uniref:phage baseplate assembly protein V n=1 Tax=Albimonas sp. CAU 1670 TaxID=3032599 RepID=UPI0023DB9AEA|nr:phage baseplate assembly protein V [Albimonas sp. CAU 1670]MDF2235423.1 phage baseplate assembly protein V [Albimonas sp. CAU 1670]
MSFQQAISLAQARAAQPRLAQVVSVDDPEGLARVQVRLLGADPDGGAESWARVAVPFAGNDRGAFLIPDVGDEVLVVFAGGDLRAPIVVGSLWNGADLPPDEVSGSVDRWSFTGKAGTRVAIMEDRAGAERVEIETPGGAKATITDEGGGKAVIRAGGATVTLRPSGVSVETGAQVTIDASAVSISTSMMSVDCPYVNFSGLVNCQTLMTTSVVSSSYTPGAGNIW